MGRHSRSTSSTGSSISAGAVVAVIAVIALLIAGVWWWLLRDSGNDDTSSDASPVSTQPAARDCTLVPVAASDPELGSLLAASWNEEQASDCIEVERVDSLADAALYVAPQDSASEQALHDAGRTVEGDPAPVAAAPADGAETIYYASALAPAGNISRQQSDAAADVACAAAADYRGTEEAAATAQLAPNLLFLLDTSEAMGPYREAAAGAIGAAALDATEAGSLAALWNYSSPLNPGVTQGWRTNVTYTESGQDVGAAVQRFGIGGTPQTRSAVLAALGNAADQAAATGEPARVVLVTSGTQGDLSDEQFRSALAGLDLTNVSLSVVHVGPSPRDGEVTSAADATAEAPQPAQVDAAVRQAAGLS